MRLFDPEKVKLGIAPIGWCNDDMPELGAENTFRQTVSEMAKAAARQTMRTTALLPASSTARSPRIAETP